MIHASYFEGALATIAAMSAIPAIRAIYRPLPPPPPPEEPIWVDVDESIRAVEKPAPKPAEKPAKNLIEPEDFEPAISLPQAPSPQYWASDDFRLDSLSAGIAPGPVQLVFRQRRRVDVNPPYNPGAFPGSSYMYFPIPELSAFDQQTRLRVGEANQSQTALRRAVGLWISVSPIGDLPGLGYPKPADPTLTGLSIQSFPYYPMSITSFGTTNQNCGVGMCTVINNTGQLVGGPPRVIQVRVILGGGADTFIGQPNAWWIFYTLVGPAPIPQRIITGA